MNTAVSRDTQLVKAQTDVRAARQAYNAAWRSNPTPVGHGVVDRALDKLEAAERELARIEKIAAR